MEERKGFGTNFGFLMASVGSAVGLGNIWGFPNKMGASGGFTFLIVYLVLAVLCGFIVMVSELALGRKTGKGVVSAYQALSKRFKWVGWLGILSPFFILFFYCALGGYCIKYTILNIGDLFHASFGANALAETAVANGHSLGAEVFGTFMANPAEAVIFGLIFVALTMLIVMGGVSGGIEKVCSVGMPALFVMLLICIIRACTLEGAVDGLKYMFVPGWAVANGVIDKEPNFFGVLSAAGGQMFFSLSLGMGIMITYGSYVKDDVDLNKANGQIEIFDTGVAFLAGIMIIPSVNVFLGVDGMASRPSLTFISLPRVFASMGGVGRIVGIVFFLALGFAALTSCVSVMETLVANCMEIFHTGRKKTVLVLTVIYLAASAVIALGYSIFYIEVKLPNGSVGQLIDIMDYISNSVMMPFIALLSAFLIGWIKTPDYVIEEMESTGDTFRRKKLYRVMIRYVVPVMMFVLFLQSTGIL